ncbi:HDIG domain-containing protein [candidate division WOR-3 bacterium]|nr:HDIG domain-containing protein [candidate division WOR-3 bacterium]
MTREEALKLIDENIKNENLKKHLFAVEACMKGLAEHFGGDASDWAMAGILHDIDYDMTKDNPELHGKIGREMLSSKGLKEEILNAIENHCKPEPPEDLMSLCLYAVDPFTGLAIASALMHPDKKIGSIDREFIKKRFKEKRFAAGANRDQIMTIEKTNLKFEDFIDVCLKSMAEISGALGL